MSGNDCITCRSKIIIDRANSIQLFSIFNKYASFEKDGKRFMTSDDFVRKYVGLLPKQKNDSVHAFTRMVNRSKTGYISYQEFQQFEGLLCKPNALYRSAFQLFTPKGSFMTFDDFEKILSQTERDYHFPFEKNSEFINLYFGKDKQRKIKFNEFSQLMRDFQRTHMEEAFRKFDPESTGFISTQSFVEIIKTAKYHHISENVQRHLLEIASNDQDKQISYPYFVAFHNILMNIDKATQIYLECTKNDRNRAVTKDEFAVRSLAQLTPMEVDILFQINSVLQKSPTIVYDNLKAIGTKSSFKEISEMLSTSPAISGYNKSYIPSELKHNLYRFILAGIAGATGATAVYPIDLVKTRMQNQRGGRLYKHGVDCFIQVVRKEGVFGLYRGLVAQLIGITPEKAMKLGANDFFRDCFKDTNGNVSVFYGALAGALAGCCQDLFTNPLEIIKIRLQVAGELKSETNKSAGQHAKELGLRGLYKGVHSCMLRDSFFSSIYFTCYTQLKCRFTASDGQVSAGALFLAGSLAGVPAAFFSTPFDVIKTRLQVIPREGQTQYKGIADCIQKIHQEEGLRAFGKGAIARVLRSSPQFGVTLLTYEALQNFFNIDFGSSSSQAPKNPDHIGGYKIVLPVFVGMQTGFGLNFKPVSSNER